ncbi:MAG: hypothetical protein IT368_03560, partial [Candidatus Hydrogenedentes bacterium]|nr:hypothetical protein [Candidatus Hydrogenedentota bacterium]
MCSEVSPEKLAALLLVVVCACAFAIDAATVQVICREDGLYPANITVYPGDTVQWVVESGSHIMSDGTPTETEGIFSFVLLDGFPPQSVQFNEVRTIPYFDWHSGPPSAPNYFFGSITVQQPLLFPGPRGLSALYFEDEYADGDVRLAVAMNDTWVAVYRQNIGQNTEGLVSVRSTDGGYTWSDTPVLISEYDFVDSVAEIVPAIAVNDLGVVMVAWASTYNLSGDYGTDLDIFTSRSFDGGATWQPPVAVPTAPFDGTSTDTNPRLVWLQGEGDALLVWESNFNIYSTAGTDNDIFFCKSMDGGASWGSPNVLTSGMNGDSASD